ncbi:TPA: hypothetical protein ACTYZW_005164 [Citrobacter freundii]|uniref:hypothetical protein n=1 Tax=Citrobacter freundii TaxID=546 RepID=UPI001A20A961|nr:hypothetical protein [Citrobacter freundii]HAT3738846.1 hypothetical protein [Citrobacter freundii]
MMSKSINYLHIAGHGATIDKIGDDLKSSGIEFNRSVRCFSAFNPEFLQIAAPVAASAVSLIAGIVVSRIQNRRVRVKLKDHPHVEEIDVGSPEDFEKVMAQIEKIYLD